MARKTTRRRYYRKFYRRYKNVTPSQQYFKVKLEAYSKISFPTTELYAQGGPTIFGINAADEDVIWADKGLLTIEQLFKHYAYKNTLSGLFSYYKITGIRVEVTPEARNTTLPTTVTVQAATLPTVMEQVYLSYRAGSNVIQNLNEVRANNQSILLDPYNKMVRYWRVFGGTTSYINTNQMFAGGFTTNSETQNSQQAIAVMDNYKMQPSWQVKFNLYILYKVSKA